ncbi:hypothetical protein Pfo_024932 [Paulownia fortunei]|nr:hypothetical protein Pfo_024932 [Paulownia fortunei]
MERRISGGAGGVVAVMVAMMMLANCVNAQIYTCWGGCYNECILRSSKTRPERLACYYQCLNSCLPPSAADYQNYCQIGCSLELCIPVSYGAGARLEKCFGRCTNLCKF